jgi:hypothetical protein
MAKAGGHGKNDVVDGSGKADESAEFSIAKHRMVIRFDIEATGIKNRAR